MPYDYVTRAAAPEAVGQHAAHDYAPAHAHAVLWHHVLFACTLKQRFIGFYELAAATATMVALRPAAPAPGTQVLLVCCCALLLLHCLRLTLIWNVFT
jgi:hypothetical protein